MEDWLNFLDHKTANSGIVKDALVSRPGARTSCRITELSVFAFPSSLRLRFCLYCRLNLVALEAFHNSLLPAFCCLCSHDFSQTLVGKTVRFHSDSFLLHHNTKQTNRTVTTGRHWWQALCSTSQLHVEDQSKEADQGCDISSLDCFVCFLLLHFTQKTWKNN